MSVEELSEVLWRDRELLDMLLFKLDEQHLVLESGRSRWLAYAAREVDTVLASIQDTEVLRAATADAVATHLGLDANPSLRSLAEATVDPWRTILLDHRDALVDVTGQISELADTNRALLTDDRPDAREGVHPSCRGAGIAHGNRLTVARLDPNTATVQCCTPPPSEPVADPHLQLAYEAALVMTGMVLQPSLLDFLR